MKIYLASGNPHKLEELRELLRARELPVEIHSADALGGMPEVEETASTFHGNAELKAEALLAKLPAEAWVLSDDSGLEVDFLNKAPGVYSARFAGPQATTAENNELLLSRLGDTEQRSARFVCVLCLKSGEETVFFEGYCEGKILKESAGFEGFGYDPLFQPLGFEQSFAELGPTIKSKHSHRARSVQHFLDWLEPRLKRLS